METEESEFCEICGVALTTERELRRSHCNECWKETEREVFLERQYELQQERKQNMCHVQRIQ